jgi:hypothetical protein
MDWVPRAHAILTAEGATVSQSDVQQMLQNFSGDARDFIDFLEEQVDAARQIDDASEVHSVQATAVLPIAVGGVT